MERFQHVPDEDVSSSGEADPKRQKSDNSGSTKRKRESKLKNVVVLLGDDVRKEDGKVYMLNRPETAQLKKPELGQLKSKIKFTETMTEKNVEEELRQHFPILRDNGRFSCASAADNRTRLEFHNSPGTVWNGSGTVWDGTKIKRLITGNAVLYVLSEVRRSVESNNSSDSAFESTTGNASGVDDNTEHSTVITLLCPKEGPIMGGTQFVICLNVKSIPENLTSLKATFKEVGVVDLTPVTAGVHSGCSPASKTLGKVAVTVGSPDGTWNSPEETEFEYYPGVTQEFQKLIAKMPDTKRNIPLDYQTLNPSRSAGTVCSPSSFSSVVDTSLMADESKDILSLKALKGILFAAAAANDRECIETIFSTSAGEAVFQTYRNSSILPENTARAMGHKDLAEYLQNIHKRLSEEIVCNVQTVTIDWVELKHATAKKDICSGTDESQGLELEGFLESDDDQTNYFADDETSICQSPSASEFEDECIESKCQNDLIQQLSKKHFTVAMVTGRSSIKMPCENEDLPEEENAPDFDEDTLRAIADVYRNEGKLNCNEKELKAKLYNNRAMAHFKLGNPRDSLRDAEAAIELNPTFLKAIVRGAAACVELKRFEEAITWCDKGLAIDKNNRILSSLRLQSVSEVGDKSMEEKDPISLDHGCASSGDFKKVIGLYNWEEDIEDLNLHLKKAKEVGDKHGKGGAYGNLGNAYDSLGDFKKAIGYHNPALEIAKIVRGKHGEGEAYGNLGNAYNSLGDLKKAMEYHNLHLKIAKEIGDKHGEGSAYGNLGNAYGRLGEFKKAIEFHNLHLKIAKEARDKHGEGSTCGNLGNAYFSLGDFKKAIEYHNLHLKIAKEVGDKHGEGGAYGNLGNAYGRLGDFKKAIEYHNLHLKIAKEVGDKHGEGVAYGNLGNAFFSLGDFKKAIEYHNLDLKIAKEVGDKHGEGGVYGNLGIAYQGLGEFKKAIEYHNLHLKIAKEVGDKHREGSAYGNLGNAYVSLGEFKKAIEFHNLHLKIAKEVGDKSFEAMAYYSLGHVFELQGGLPKAVEYYEASINLFDSLRVLLKSKDEWKVNFRNQHQMAYTGLWRVLVEQGNVDEALFVAEKGRAQALTDLMESSFCGGTSHHKGEDEDFTVLKNVPSNTVFQAVDKANVNLWVVSEGKQVRLRQSKLKGFVSENSGVSQSFESFMLGVYTQLGVRSNVRCENRSLDALREGRSKVDEKTKEANPQPHIQQDGCLSTLYDIVMKPVADLIEGDELLIIPDGPLWIAPYAALKDGNSKYLCESFTIRVAPSLASVRLIADCPDDYHKSSGALLVGDPWVSEVTNSEGEKVLEQLPCAKEEVEMIGKILNITPITGRQATKREVFKRLSSVSLVHFAAHGCPETGEIALTPDLDRISTVPTEKEDYILTIRDVLNVQLRAKLVVLSCCHSGRGEIKAEGVVGIARAFMGAGARSVVVSLWAIDDEATLQFMKCFYQHLAEGKPTSKSLNLAMKSLRESDEFHEIKYWAPFLLIGDDVTFDLMAKERENLNRKSNK